MKCKLKIQPGTELQSSTGLQRSESRNGRLSFITIMRYQSGFKSEREKDGEDERKEGETWERQVG